MHQARRRVTARSPPGDDVSAPILAAQCEIIRKREIGLREFEPQVLGPGGGARNRRRIAVNGHKFAGVRRTRQLSANAPFPGKPCLSNLTASAFSRLKFLIGAGCSRGRTTSRRPQALRASWAILTDSEIPPYPLGIILENRTAARLDEIDVRLEARLRNSKAGESVVPAFCWRKRGVVAA